MDDDLNLEDEAKKWMDEHPRTMDLYREYAMKFLAEGRRFGIGDITERIRWHRKTAEDKGGEFFKIPNDFRAYVSRRLIDEEPRLSGLLEIRRTRSAKKKRRNRPPDPPINPLIQWHV